jgi:uncharacterized protein with PIN domain
MLSRLGKWLRAAGHDTHIIGAPIPDRDVLAVALSDSRLLITRDRHFLKMKGAQPILIYLKNNNFDSCITELIQKLWIDWLCAPFSRCLICNSLFEKPNDHDLEEKIPLRIRQQKQEFWYCPTCQKFYWEGTHTTKMRHQLMRWQNETNQFFPLRDL